MILFRPGTAKLTGIRKQSLQGCEFDRRHADGIRVENIPRNHNVGRPREDSKSNDKTYSVNLSTSQTESCSCQCTTTLNGKQKETKKCEYNSQTVANCVRKFPRSHRSILGPGSEKKWYGTYTDKPDGSWNQSEENMTANFSGSGHPMFRASSAFEREESRSKEEGKEVNTLQWLS